MGSLCRSFRAGLIGQKLISRKLIFDTFHAYFEMRKSVENDARHHMLGYVWLG